MKHPTILNLSDIIELYVEQELEQATAGMNPSVAGQYRLDQRNAIATRGLLLILDELSEELLSLAGKGLRIQGQRRVLDALDIPRDKAE